MSKLQHRMQNLDLSEMIKVGINYSSFQSIMKRRMATNLRTFTIYVTSFKEGLNQHRLSETRDAKLTIINEKRIKY